MTLLVNPSLRPLASFLMVILQISFFNVVVATSPFMLVVDHTNAIAAPEQFQGGRQLDDHSHELVDDRGDKPWGKMIGLTLLVNLITLSGVVFLLPLMSRKIRARIHGIELQKPEEEGLSFSKILGISIPSFAGGALLALAFFIVIPESLYELTKGITEETGIDPHAGHNHRFLHEEEEVHDDHAGEVPTAVVWRFATSVCSGFLISMLFGIISPHHDHHHDIVETPLTTVAAPKEHQQQQPGPEKFQEDTAAVLEEGEQKVLGNDQEDTLKKINLSLILTLVFGDALCNFADGVFIGFSLLQCDITVTYSVMAGVLYHEIASEVADFFLFTTHAGLTVIQALIVNFIGGLTVCLGGVVVFSSNVNSLGVGAGLAIAVGVYIYLATIIALPRARAMAKTRLETLLSIGMFILGVIPLGLVLLSHTHCH